MSAAPVALLAGFQNSASPAARPYPPELWDRGPGGRHGRQRLSIVDSYRGALGDWLAADYIERAGPVPVRVPDTSGRPASKIAPRVWFSWDEAGRVLRQRADDLKAARVRIAFDESELRYRARLAADHCMKLARNLAACTRYAQSVGIEVPQPGDPTPTAEGILRRLYSPRWWHRKMRAAYSMRAESALRDMGRVHRQQDVYASGFSVARRASQKARNLAFIQDRIAVCEETGQQIELFDIVQGSIANPAVRRAEFMVRIRGLERVATEAGHAAQFYTLTTPSAYHARTADGRDNPGYAGHSPKAGQAYLCKLWARVRAKFKRLALAVYGFRIAEPHHDGTPHWHLLLWMPAHQADTVTAILRGYALAESPNEPGARLHRLTVETIDPAKGGATAYVAKYVAKNIDGHAVGQDLDSLTPAEQSVIRVDAWAATHRIRQFQAIGAPPVGLWRELRRLREPVQDCEALEQARAAVDAGDFAGFVRALGGIEHFRAAPLTVKKERTGELNEWGEVKAPQVAGIQCGLFFVRTREKVWLIVARPGMLAILGPVPITVRGAAGADFQQSGRSDHAAGFSRPSG